MAISKFTGAQLESLAKTLGDAFTGSEITRLLQRANLPDSETESTKWRRLLDVFQKDQAQYGVGSHVGAFIQVALEPAQWHGAPDRYEGTRGEINATLSYSGLEVGQNGKLARATKATTLSEAQDRAGRLRRLLLQRGVHGDVLEFCRAELLHENYFHAVLEATKSVAAKIRDKSGCTSDGSRLVDAAFDGDPTRLPRLAFNPLLTPTHWSEQRGLMNLLKGMFGTFRNPAAHEPRITWAVSEPDALDLLTLASLLHRRVEMAAVARRDSE